MKRIYYVMAMLLLSVISMSAQVTIGSQEDPHPAAVLDLQSTTDPGKGLLLPKVELTNISHFPFSNDLEVQQKGEGLIIYCPGKYVTAGLYLWNGSKWVLLVATQEEKTTN